MPNKQQDLEKVLALKDGEECYINWFGGSGARVVRVLDCYELYEESEFGKDQYYQTYQHDYIAALVDRAYSWT